MNEQTGNSNLIKVLFVDDEELVLQGLKRQLRGQRKNWDMKFQKSASDALELLSKEHMDVIVSDMRMPGMNGAELLNEVRERWPEMVRLVLSGQTDQSELLMHIGCIHQYLQKPCDPDNLIHVVSRVHSLISSVESSELRTVVAGLDSLPVVPEVYLRLVEELNSDSSNAEIIAQIVQEDVGLSVKLLQLVNSTFFGMPREITSVKDAIVLIGMNNLVNLVLTAKIFDTLSANAVSSAYVSKLWRDCGDLGASAKCMAKTAGQSSDVYESAYLSGVLSHVGRALVAHSLPDLFNEIMELVKQESISISDAELNVLGVGQEVIGAYALGIWGFAYSVIESVARQESPNMSIVKYANHPLLWLHIARSQVGPTKSVDSIQIDADWVKGIGLDATDLNEYRSAA
ncbi:MAG: HDOD domain-containing protein [Phycisphaerales bacterium]|nr:HDOD domain-containing protein [Phycisphaerales bacterium]